MCEHHCQYQNSWGQLRNGGWRQAVLGDERWCTCQTTTKTKRIRAENCLVRNVKRPNVGMPWYKLLSLVIYNNWAGPWENVSYVICEQQWRRSACFLCLDSIISRDSLAEISRLASVAAQAGLCLIWLETSKDTFCRVVAHIYMVKHVTGEIISDGNAQHRVFSKPNRLMAQIIIWNTAKEPDTSIPTELHACPAKTVSDRPVYLTEWRRLWSDCSDAQVGLHLNFMHLTFVGVLVPRLKIIQITFFNITHNKIIGLNTISFFKSQTTYTQTSIYRIWEQANSL